MDMGYPQFNQMVDSRGKTVGVGGACFGERKVFTLVFHARCFLYGKIPYMQFIQNRVGGKVKIRNGMIMPSGRVG
jgi:hypothetical protein